MNAITRIIFAALTLAVMGLNPNPAAAAPGEEFTCRHDAVQVYNFVECRRCGPCSTEGGDRIARNESDKNTTGLLNLSERLARANGAISSLRKDAKSNRELISGLEVRINELEERLRMSCFQIQEAGPQTACLKLVEAATATSQTKALETFARALESGHKFRGTVVVGKVEGLTGGFYADFETKDEPLPAFANARRRPAAPEVDALPWSYFAAGAGGCFALAGVGYGVADGFDVNFDTRDYKEGDEDKGIAFGCGVGIVGGVLFAWLHNSNINDGDDD